MTKVLRAAAEMTLMASVALGTFGAGVTAGSGCPWPYPAALAAIAVLAASAWTKWFGGVR